VVVSRSLLWSPLELWMYHRDGGTGVRVTTGRNSPDESYEQWKNVVGAVPSKDGRYFYYATRRGTSGYNAIFPLWQLARLDRETGVEMSLTKAQGSAMRPALSPDGR